MTTLLALLLVGFLVLGIKMIPTIIDNKQRKKIEKERNDITPMGFRSVDFSARQIKILKEKNQTL